jgi:hypothetical protein
MLQLIEKAHGASIVATNMMMTARNVFIGYRHKH